MSIAIVRAFIALKEMILNYQNLAEQINDIKKTVASHDDQIVQIYRVIETMLTKDDEQKAWKRRARIGFKK